MNKSAAIAAILSGALGFASVASAVPAIGENGGHEVPAYGSTLSTQPEALEHQADRIGGGATVVTPAWGGYGYQPAPSYDHRHDRRDHDRYGDRDGRRNDGYNGAYYGAPEYYSYNGPQLYPGGYLPYEYRQPSYYINDWQAYPGLYAPPYGYQWMQVGNNFLLVALATGLIANLLSQ